MLVIGYSDYIMICMKDSVDYVLDQTFAKEIHHVRLVDCEIQGFQYILIV